MAFNPAQPIVVKVEINVGALGWVEITTRGRGVSCAIRQGRSAGAIQAETSRLDLELGNPDGFLTEGNAVSPYYPYFGRGCEIRVSRIGLAVSPAERFHGQVDSITERFPGGNVDATVVITAIGTLGIIGQGSDPLRSPMYRGIPRDNPLAWWPLETDARSGLPGGSPMAQSGQVNFGANTGHPGSAPLPDYTGGGRLKARLPNGAVSNSFRAEFTARFGTGSNSIADFTTVVDISMPLGDVNVWEFFVTDALSIVGAKGAAFQWSDTTGAFTGALQTNALVDDGEWHHFRADVAQSGGNISVTFTVDGVVAGTSTLVGKNLDCSRSRVTVNPLQAKAAYVGAVGHVAWWAPHTPTSINTAVLATGYAGETAADRMVRLCSEEGVAFELTGSAADTPPMGPQLIDTLAANLRDCEQVDQGLMHDNGTAGAIGYVTNTHLYNQTATINVVKGAVEPGLEAVRDNRYTRNDVTSRRPNGGSAHVADEDHVAQVRARLKDTRTVNVRTDQQLPDDASWAVHIGTASGARYNSVGINLRNADGALLADQVAAHEIGDRITVAKSALPPQHHIDGIDGLTVGWTELLDADTWVFRPNVVPYQPYQVFVVQDQTRGRDDTDGAALLTTETSTDTSFTVLTTPSQNPVWINSTSRPGDFPFDVGCAGEQIRVTAATAPQVTFRGSGTAAHANNASVTPALPAGLAQGDLLLVYAATRSLAGSPNLPSGYTQLFNGGNFELYGKIAGASESAPSITFSGTVLGDTTSAQTAAFQGVDTTVLGAAWQPNASAQNIATPALTVRRDYALAIWLGWKQTSDTSTSFGFSLIGDMTSALGSTQSMAWYYQIQSSASSRAPNTITVTGGVAAVSAAATIALPQNRQTLTVTRSINGVVKALPAGTAISRWKPQVIAL